MSRFKKDYNSFLIETNMSIHKITRLDANKLYDKVFLDYDAVTMRELCLTDLFFLLTRGCKRKDMNNDWCYARCREVEANPDGYLDLWAREHFKSSIITFGLTIKDILNNPELTICILSHTNPIAKAFLNQIKREFEVNTFLQNLFPEVLYKNPSKEAPRWSLDAGIIIKRKGNPKESTIEASGLVDGQPTSKHYNILIYDDVVTRESVSTPEMIEKVTEAFSLSLNLGGQNCKRRYIGTRYNHADTYKTIMDRGTAIPRIYPATKDGTIEGEPVLLTKEALLDKLRDMGSYVFASQLLQNPTADKAMGFKQEWIEYYDIIRRAEKWNIYILVDPASEKKKNNDYTVITVIGLGQDKNYYLLDAVRDRLNLTERTTKLFDLVRRWNPLSVGYEKYGMQADIEHIKYVQEQEGYRFNIVPLGGQMGKLDRIRRLVPLFENKRFYLPRRLLYVGQDMKGYDFISQFVGEYIDFPVSAHDDMLDCVARITDETLMAVFPQVMETIPLNVPIDNQVYDPLSLKVVPANTNYVPNRNSQTFREAITRR